MVGCVRESLASRRRDGDPSPLLSTGEVLSTCSAGVRAGLPSPRKHGHAGKSPVKGHSDD